VIVSFFARRRPSVGVRGPGIRPEARVRGPGESRQL